MYGEVVRYVRYRTYGTVLRFHVFHACDTEPVPAHNSAIFLFLSTCSSSALFLGYLYSFGSLRTFILQGTLWPDGQRTNPAAFHVLEPN